LTIDARANGYLGTKLAKMLISAKVMPEYYDNDFVVLMVSGETGYEELNALQNALGSIPVKKRQERITFNVPHKAKMSMKKALNSPTEEIPVAEAEKRILACPTVSCPPAVPVLFGGEVITAQAIEMFTYYGITKVKVVKE
ncbi:MAG: amino acid decarboxylase, partial [Clostridia bacterium]|nr:amino acid decarboxylase [Clostridia bacterium]